MPHDSSRSQHPNRTLHASRLESLAGKTSSIASPSSLMPAPSSGEHSETIELDRIDNGIVVRCLENSSLYRCGHKEQRRQWAYFNGPTAGTQPKTHFEQIEMRSRISPEFRKGLRLLHIVVLSSSTLCGGPLLAARDRRLPVGKHSETGRTLRDLLPVL